MSDDESTQEIDIHALRESLAAARAAHVSPPTRDPDMASVVGVPVPESIALLAATDLEELDTFSGALPEHAETELEPRPFGYVPPPPRFGAETDTTQAMDTPRYEGLEITAVTPVQELPPTARADAPPATLAAATAPLFDETLPSAKDSPRLGSPDTREIAIDVRRSFAEADEDEAAAAAELHDTVPPPPEDAIVELDSSEIEEEPEPPALSRPPASLSFRAPVVAPDYAPLGDLDAEERALEGAKRFDQLIALYIKRSEVAARPSKKIPWLLKMAAVHERHLRDAAEAFEILVRAFELSPDHPDVVAMLDRVAKENGRIGELADRVVQRLLPSASDDKRLLYFAHLVYWYERVLVRGDEAGPFVAEVERLDKMHPILLRRAAQIAATSGDTRTQREHLLRALERTVRREEKVTLYIALASAHAGTPDAFKYYELALELDPTSLVAIQGVKYLGKAKENYAQVVWALERQADVAPTEAERVDALLELAELHETRFLKREDAAALLERVLMLEPSQPAAMKGLERCYHALRDWPKLARILKLRADHTFDPEAKVEVLERAAEVFESKLGDLGAAAELHRKLLVLEPRHRRALGDLARIYERLADWENFVFVKARLAELAPTKRATSQELVKLGDFLDSPERDRFAAKAQYENAVALDPTNAAGWEALQRIATDAGDTARVLACLEQRQKHTDVPRQRAAVLVELARVQRQSGDEAAAKKNFEAAVQADPANEAAAIEVLAITTSEERWAEAAPLCELLVNAAVRDRDGEALFARLRLGTRIAAAIGDAERALTMAIDAVAAQPNDVGARSDLLEVADQCRELPDALTRARAALVRMAETCAGLPIEQLARLAGLLRDVGESELATATFEIVREADPDHPDALQALGESYLATGEFARAAKLKVDTARHARDPDARFELLRDAGDIWAKRAGELEAGASLYEEARSLKPLEPALLDSMAWVYGELGDSERLASMLEDVVAAPIDQSRKIDKLVKMAELAKQKLGDRVRAAEILDRILDLDAKRLDLFEEIVRALTEAKDWDRLEDAYRRMVIRAQERGDVKLEVMLLQQLGLICRDRVGATDRAYDAFDAASRLAPENAELRKIVVELLVVTDRLDNAVARVREEIEREPLEPELYAELYDLFLRQRAFDKAWSTVNVLSRLREPTSDQRRFHDDYAPMPLDGIPGQIVAAAWRSHVFHRDLDAALTEIFALVTPAVVRMRQEQLRPEQLVGRPFTANHTRIHDLVRATFHDAAEILAVPSPELLHGEAGAAAPFFPSLAAPDAVLVCGAAIEAQAVSLVYLVGRALAAQRPELAARALFPTVHELTSILAMALRVGRGEAARDAAGAAIDQIFAASLAPEAAEALRDLALQTAADPTVVDVKRWAMAADLSCLRPGLLLAGDVEPARLAIVAEAGSTADARTKTGELYKFATSDLYAELRGAIGIAVQG